MLVLVVKHAHFHALARRLLLVRFKLIELVDDRGFRPRRVGQVAVDLRRFGRLDARRAAPSADRSRSRAPVPGLRPTQRPCRQRNPTLAHASLAMKRACTYPPATSFDEGNTNAGTHTRLKQREVVHVRVNPSDIGKKRKQPPVVLKRSSGPRAAAIAAARSAIQPFTAPRSRLSKASPVGPNASAHRRFASSARP